MLLGGSAGGKHLYFAIVKHRTLHSWNASIRRDLGTHLLPQLTWLLTGTSLKQMSEAQQPLKKPVWKGNRLQTSFHFDEPTNQ